MKPQLSQLVHYQELGNVFAAIVTRVTETPGDKVDLTVFGKTGESYRTAPYSDKPKDGHWTPKPVTKK